MTDQLPEGWIPLSQGVGWIVDRLMVRAPEFVINNWDCKYLDVRVDMRTGAMLIRPGNERGDLTFVEEASGLIELLESDFGQSGADVRYEAIRCELVAAFNRGKRAAQPPLGEQS